MPRRKKDTQYLTAAEMHTLELGDAQAQLRSSREKEDQLKLQALKLQVELWQTKYQLAATEAVQRKQQHYEEQQKHKVKLQKIKQKYDLPADKPWGHDPVSGEIKR